MIRLPGLKDAKTVECDGERFCVLFVTTRRVGRVDAVVAEVADSLGVVRTVQLAGPRPTARVVEFRI